MFIACFVIFLVSASIVSAREDAKPGLYVDGGASVYILDMPSYQPIATRNMAPSYTAINRLSAYDDNAVGMLGSLTLGWKAATPLYFELTGRTFEDQGHSQRYFNYAAYGADAVGISFPSGNLPTYFASTVTVSASTQVRFGESAGRLVAGYALDLGSGVTLSPFVGGEIMRISQEYDVDWRSLTIINLQEDLDAVYTGLLAGARLQADWSGCRFGLTGSVARYNVRSGYVGTMDVANSTRFDSRSINGTASATGLELAADVSRGWGRWTVGLRGGMRYLSYVPRILASTRDPTLGNSVSSDITHLGAYHSRAYSLGVTLGCAF
ncbi:hypothetical protein [Desulfocurvus sp. DL9XJH121]